MSFDTTNSGSDHAHSPRDNQTPPGSDELRCRYSNKKCMNPRAQKRTGGLHTFCEEHRENANRNQRKLDLKKRVEKRQQEAIQSYYETLEAVQRLENQAHQHWGSEMSNAAYAPAQGDAFVEPCARPAELLKEDVDVLVHLFGPGEMADSRFDDDGSLLL